MADDDNAAAAGIEPARTAPPFIAKVPKLLLRPERRLSVVVPAAGLLLGIGASLACFSSTPPGSMLYKTFDPRQSHAIIPYAIFCMFFWGIAICLSRRRRLRALTAVSDPALLSRAITVLQSDDGVAALQATLHYPTCMASPLLRRMSVILEQWTIAPGLQDAEVVHANQVALDADASQRGYTLVRVMVWALPVLGLIGTVLGIAAAVGGFANFLGQDVNDVGQIRLKLVEVTGGLSFAFLITLQGLLTSLIVMLLVSTLQSSEDRLFARIQRSIAETFLPVLQRAAPPVPATSGQPWQDWIDEFNKVAEAAVHAVRTAAEQAVEQLATVGKSGTETVQAAAQWATGAITEVAGQAVHRLVTVGETSTAVVQAAAQQATGAITETTGQAVHQLVTAGEASAGAVQAAAQQATGAITETTGQAVHQVVAVGEASAGAVQAAAQQATDTITETTGQAVHQLAAVGEASAGALRATAEQGIGTIAEAGKATLEQMHDEREAHTLQIQALLGRSSEALELLAAGLRDAFAGQSTTTERLVATTDKIGESLERVAAMQVTLAAVLSRTEQLHATGTLDALRTAIDRLGPVLDRFQQPFVLQAMPLPQR